MVSKCANPSCDTPFRYFRGGMLFVFEPHERSSSDLILSIEHFWLCECCAPSMTLVVDAGGHPRLEPVQRTRPAV
jgi:hypothetical protein